MLTRFFCCLFLTATLLGVGSVNRASADTLTFVTTMAGSNEVPANFSPATGSSVVTVVGNTLTVSINFTGLTGGAASAAHIHCCAAVGTTIGVAVGFPGFPATPSGSYTFTFNMLDPAIYTANFLNTFGGGTAAGAQAALIAGMQNGQAYTNIHNTVFPGGEIRGQLALLPEPSTMLLLGTGLVGVMSLARKRRRRP